MGKIKSIIANIRYVWSDLREQRNEEGLTLIELMVVVVILGIIAAIAIPSISGAMTNARINSTESTLSTIQESLQRYYIDNNSYPSGLSNLSAYLENTSPKDAWSKNINYLQEGSGTGYIVFSTAGTSNPTDSLASGDYYAAGGTGLPAGISPTTPVKD